MAEERQALRAVVLARQMALPPARAKVRLDATLLAGEAVQASCLKLFVHVLTVGGKAEADKWPKRTYASLR